MAYEPLTPEGFDEALVALGWKGSDFCDRAGLVPNTVWRWRKGLSPIPLWAGEYLRAMLAIQRLSADFLAPRRAKREAGVDDTGEAGPDETGSLPAGVDAG